MLDYSSCSSSCTQHASSHIYTHANDTYLKHTDTLSCAVLQVFSSLETLAVKVDGHRTKQKTWSPYYELTEAAIVTETDFIIT